jgi:hypothetical protein
MKNSFFFICEFLATKICSCLEYPSTFHNFWLLYVSIGWWLESRVWGTHLCDCEGCRPWSSSSSAQTGSHTHQIILGWEPNACAIQCTQWHVTCTTTTDSRHMAIIESSVSAKSVTCLNPPCSTTRYSCLCIRATGATASYIAVYLSGCTGAWYRLSPKKTGGITVE